MKSFFFATTAIVTFLLANIAWAASDVMLEWQMTETTDVIGYKMYYSTDENMQNKTWHEEFGTPVENPALSFSTTCSNVDIDPTQTTYFYIAAVTTDSEVASDIKTIAGISPSTLSVVQNLRIISDESTPTFDSAINFQPSDAPVPSGFLADSGESYNATLGYGWTQPPASWGPRDRNNPASPDQAYDTMIHVKPEAVWEMAINNGSYRVTICLGDPSYPTGTPNVQAEGHTIVSGQTLLSRTNRWIEESADIQVTDGRLTITYTGSTDPARICWIKVDSL